MTTQRPTAAEHSRYHETLISLVPDDIIQTLEQQVDSISEFVKSIPDEATETIHAPYGWTVRQVVEHCIDAERVFGYRVLRFSTNEDVELPGWDENLYAATGYGPNANLAALADEYTAVRQANLLLVKRLAAEAWGYSGVADGNPYSVRSIIWLMAGHWIHHQQILRSRLSS